MALFGSRKGGEWYMKVKKAEEREKKAKKKYEDAPTKANYSAWWGARKERLDIEANYYD